MIPMLGKLSAILGHKPAAARPRTSEPTRVHVMPTDSLEITFQRGNTLSQTARAYGEPVGGGAPGVRKAFLDQLITQNGGKDLIVAGRTFKLATGENQSYAINAAIAVQKSIASRLRQGELFPPFDYNNAKVEHGPYHALVVTLPSTYGAQKFFVFDDASGEDTSLFTVFTEKEFNQAQGR